MCQNYKSERGVDERWCKRISCSTEGNHLRVSRSSSRKIFSPKRRSVAIKSRRKILQGHLAQKKSRKKRVHREVSSISVGLMSVILARPSLRRGHLARRKMRPQSSMGLGENIYKLKSADRTTFFSPVEVKATPAPTSKLPEERKFVVDSGASMHMPSKTDLSSDELETLRRSRTHTVVGVCWRYWPLRDCAITRRYACSSIVGKTLSLSFNNSSAVDRAKYLFQPRGLSGKQQQGSDSRAPPAQKRLYSTLRAHPARSSNSDSGLSSTRSSNRFHE